jgi:hypothetical protein
MLNIGLDFDKTYTSAPQLWDRFVSDAHESGHHVWCVTSRVKSPKNIREVVIPGVETVFCGFASKVWYMENKRGVKIDIWIDDDPDMCVYGKVDSRPVVRTQSKLWRANVSRHRRR